MLNYNNCYRKSIKSFQIMPFKEIMRLRNNGELEAAYQMAKAEYEENSANEWTQRAYFWVLRDKCVLYIDEGSYEKARSLLEFMSGLLATMNDSSGIAEKNFAYLKNRLDKTFVDIMKADGLSKSSPSAAFEVVEEYVCSHQELDDMHKTQLGWILYRYLKSQLSTLSVERFTFLLECYLNFQLPRPSLLHSLFIQLSVAFSLKHVDYSSYRHLTDCKALLFSPDDFRASVIDNKSYSPVFLRFAHYLFQSGEQFSLADIISVHEGICNGNVIIEMFREAHFRYIYGLNKLKQPHQMAQSMQCYIKWNNGCESSEWHTKNIRFAEYCLDDNYNSLFFEMLKQWGIDMFLPEDWQQTVASDGTAYRPFVLKFAKRCFEYVRSERLKSNEHLDSLSLLYEAIESRCQKDEWAMRQHAIVYAWRSDFLSAIRIYKSLLHEMVDRYYLWSELAGFVMNDDTLTIGLLSKALTLERNEQYIGATRLALAEVLLRQGKMQEAATELAFYARNRQVLNQRYRLLSEKVIGVKPLDSNKLFYASSISVAMNFVFDDLDSTIMTLVDKNKQNGKEYCFLTDGKGINARVAVRHYPFLAKASLGSSYMTKYKMREDQSKGKCVIYMLDVIKQPLWSNLPHADGVVTRMSEKGIHIITPDTSSYYAQHFLAHDISIGNYVSFYFYKQYQKGQCVNHVVNVQQITDEKDIEKLCQCYPTSIVAINHINQEKKLFHVTDAEGIEANILMGQVDLEPRLGQILEIRYAHKVVDKSIRISVIEAKPSDVGNSKAIKWISGMLELVSSSRAAFAFVDKKYYVSKEILHRYSITETCFVQGYAVYNGENRWSVYELRIL